MSEADTQQNAPIDSSVRVEGVVMRFPTSTLNELRGIASILEEAAENLRGMMDTQKAEELQVREWLPDELEGSALMLRDMANRAERA